MISKRLFSQSKVLALDTETTSLDTTQARVIEFGFSIFENGEFSNRDSFFIYPGFEISEEVTQITGIEQSNLKGCATFADRAEYIKFLLANADVWMFYNAPYDVGVLKHEFARVGMTLPDKPVIDVLVMFRKFERNHKGKKLVDAANRYSIPFISAHRADDDAHMTQQVFWRMLKIKPELNDNVEITIKKQRDWAESQANQLQNFFRFSKRGEPFRYPDLSVYERGFPKEIFEETKKKREARKKK